MKKINPAHIALAVFTIFAFLLFSIVPPPAQMELMDTPEASPVVLGVFEGVTPCADCPGITTRLTLVQYAEYYAEGTYELSLTYIDRDVEPYVQEGIWTTERGTPTDPDATVYALDPDRPDVTQRYVKKTDTSIRLVNQDGTEIDPSLPFTLTRIDGE